MNTKLKHIPKYEDIYGNNASEQKYIAEIMLENISNMENILKC